MPEALLTVLRTVALLVGALSPLFSAEPAVMFVSGVCLAALLSEGRHAR
jgi:hypothetical protein